LPKQFLPLLFLTINLELLLPANGPPQSIQLLWNCFW
jgi:hypothetical protein